MGTRVYSTLGDLERDMRIIATEFKPRMSREVKGVAVDGNRVATASARRTSGRHGVHYPNAFSVERKTPLSYEWGPDADKPQGGMSFNEGSRNQPPHHDIEKGTDLHGAGDLSRRADRVLDGLFWP